MCIPIINTYAYVIVYVHCQHQRDMDTLRMCIRKVVPMRTVTDGQWVACTVHTAAMHALYHCCTTWVIPIDHT